MIESNGMTDKIRFSLVNIDSDDVSELFVFIDESAAGRKADGK